MQTTILVSLISALLVLLLAVIAFAVKRWVEHVDGLQASMDQLRDSILGLSDKFVTQAQHDKDLEALRTSALGRRVSDRCPATDCPYEATQGRP
jgi:hypothetical protein